MVPEATNEVPVVNVMSPPSLVPSMVTVAPVPEPDPAEMVGVPMPMPLKLWLTPFPGEPISTVWVVGFQ